MPENVINEMRRLLEDALNCLDDEVEVYDRIVGFLSKEEVPRRVRVLQDSPERTEVIVTSPSGEDGADELRFIFTNEGLVIDSVVDDEVDNTSSSTYEEIERSIYG